MSEAPKSAAPSPDDEALRGEVVALLNAVFCAPEVHEPIARENRRQPRQRVLVPAVLVGKDDGSYACIIRDMNLSGARIAVSRHAKLKPSMRLRVEGKSTREVTVKWRRGEFVGVRFSTGE